VRVIAGTARGMKLFAPKGLTTRPPLDHIKEALFNIISGEVEGVNVLDLYAGSGSFGIEALSRGAASAVFVEEDRAAIEALRKNLKKTGFLEKARISRLSVQSFLEKRSSGGGLFDLIFLDPPFRISLIDIRTVFKVLQQADLIEESAMVILRVNSIRDVPVSPGFDLEKDRTYGDSRLLFYRRRKA